MARACACRAAAFVRRFTEISPSLSVFDDFRSQIALKAM
jgi:hypothetical protein